MQVECFVNLHFITIQHISFNSVVSLSRRVSFISVPLYKLWIEMWAVEASRASVFRAFSQENIVQLNFP